MSPARNRSHTLHSEGSPEKCITNISQFLSPSITSIGLISSISHLLDLSIFKYLRSFTFILCIRHLHRIALQSPFLVLVQWCLDSTTDDIHENRSKYLDTRPHKVLIQLKQVDYWRGFQKNVHDNSTLNLY